MNNNKREMLVKVLDLIKEDYVFHKSTFELQNAFFCNLSDENYKRVDYLLKATRQDFSKILTIMNCIESTFSMYRDDAFKREYFEMNDIALEEIGCHIEYLFTKYRVILEYMEEILEICIPPILSDDKKEEYNEMVNKKGAKAKAARFDYLLECISTDDNEGKKILNTDWFQDFRENRNFLVHRGAGCIVYGDKNELLFNVMRIDEMEREDILCIEEYFLTDNGLIKYHRFWGIMLSELIVFCEIIFNFLLDNACIPEEQLYFPSISNCSKRMFVCEEISDKQSVLDRILLMILREE